jgi:hypothetical protein
MLEFFIMLCNKPKTLDVCHSYLVYCRRDSLVKSSELPVTETGSMQLSGLEKSSNNIGRWLPHMIMGRYSQIVFMNDESAEKFPSNIPYFRHYTKGSIALKYRARSLFNNYFRK